MIDEDDTILDGYTTCDECGTKVHYNDNGYECGKCGHSCC